MSKKRGRTLTLGVIIGFFIGLFLAPKKGKELRRDAKEKIDTIKENPKDVLHETFEDVKDVNYPFYSSFFMQGGHVCVFVQAIKLA